MQTPLKFFILDTFFQRLQVWRWNLTSYIMIKCNWLDSGQSPLISYGCNWEGCVTFGILVAEQTQGEVRSVVRQLPYIFFIIFFVKRFDHCKPGFTGEIPMQRGWLVILLSEQGMLSVNYFKSLDDILIYPALDLGFSWHITLTISVGLVYRKKKELEQGVSR